MNILAELTALLGSLNIAVETGVFSDVAPVEYVVITPLLDSFPLFASDSPEFEMQEVRLSLFSKGNYLALKSSIVAALLGGDFTITERRYIGHEDDTGYHHYAIDVAKVYPLEE